jgi:hypothetical protein
MRTLVLSNLWGVLAATPARGGERIKVAIFRLKAAAMAGAYQRTFSRLARAFGVTIVGGSIVLPAPRVAPDGTLVAGDAGALHNVAALFRPDGRVDPALVRKVFLIDSERAFLAAGAVAELPVFRTPAGRLGVLLCADAWYPESHAVLRGRGAELVAVPAFADGDGSWGARWQGYNGAPAPADVESADVRRLREAEAWLKYGLAGRLRAGGARAGITVFLRGALWDLGSDGQTIAVAAGGRVERGAHLIAGAALFNLWL